MELVSYYGIYNDLSIEWDENKKEAEQNFYQAKTGIPIVDAVVTQLKCYGYITNRGRQIIPGYMTIEQNIDWRLGMKFY